MFEVRTLNRISIEDLEQYISDSVFGYFSYGSFVYKNKTPEDYDLIVITQNHNGQKSVVVEDKEYQFSFYDIETFSKMIEKEDICFWEIYSLLKHNTDQVIFDYKDELLDIFNQHSLILLNLRSSISGICSNSYVKAKKKIIVENDLDLNVSMKSLWHSIRIANFGAQVATNGFVTDFKSVNELYNEIVLDYSKYNDFDTPIAFWDYIHKKYKPIHNKQLSDFRTLCPK
ncbi:MAG: hypothetical protein CL760_12830 [Chloroflexi bacterium]|nr:hypothetical protein [Chloroflexota bacterium]|tara:strand:- start:45150 stop:45836 length:687 start_codon:yes stop_codon:yes gene_type:complete